MNQQTINKSDLKGYRRKLKKLKTELMKPADQSEIISKAYRHIGSLESKISHAITSIQELIELADTREQYFVVGYLQGILSDLNK